MALTRSAPAAARTASFEVRGAVRFWLIAVAGLVFLMVLVGGATRLTESGLSITQWKPVTGVIPPLSGAEWQAEFDRYKQIPQFATLNPDMTLDGFKTIFWWEWGHRLLARVVGAAFIMPGLWFWRQRPAQGRARPAGRGRDRLAGARADRRLVDGDLGPERAHRGGAAAAGAAPDDRRGDVRRADLRRGRTWRTAAPGRRRGPGLRDFRPPVRRAVFCQLGLGALVAGLRAGLIYNTWPLMGSSFIPGEAFKPSWLQAILNDPATAQFDHRLLAYAIVAFAVLQAVAALRAAPGAPVASRAVVLAAVAMLQVGLGIATLLSLVPVELALAHQALALALFGLAIVHLRATEIEQGRE